MHLVDAVAQRGRRLRELGAVVDSECRRRLGTAIGGGDASRLDDLFDRVGQVQLALRVRRRELPQRGPEIGALEDVDRRVELGDRALLG